MFRRRQPRPFWQQLRHWLWPKIGWRRAGHYMVKRLTRLPGTPHSIAAGFACGAAISFTPFLGFHILLACLLCLVVRGNFLAAAVGTVVGNPWTFPFIWILTYQLGHWLLGTDLTYVPPAEAWTLQRVTDNIHRLIWPMTVGGIPSGLIAGLLLYFPLARGITAFQDARRRRRERRRALREGKLGVGTARASLDQTT